MFKGKKKKVKINEQGKKEQKRTHNKEGKKKLKEKRQKDTDRAEIQYGVEEKFG